MHSKKYKFTREQLINAVARLEVHVPAQGAMAGKVSADQFVDALLQALENPVDGNVHP